MIALILVAAFGSVSRWAVLFSPYGDPTRIYDGTDTRAFALLIGAALALALPRARIYPPVTTGARRLLDVVGGWRCSGSSPCSGAPGNTTPSCTAAGWCCSPSSRPW